MDLISRLLNDRTSGLKRDGEGRLYFKQRRVTFRTIYADENEIFGTTLPGFENTLKPLQWESEPSHLEIQNFSETSSRRYLTFWYSVFEVAAARALSGKDRDVYRLPFYKRSTFFDLGIPENHKWSSVSRLLHEKILREYKNLRSIPLRYPIFYLGDYLCGITDDVREALAPYSAFWNLLKKREESLNSIGHPAYRILAPLYSRHARGKKNSLEWIELFIQESMEASLTFHIQKGEFARIENDDLRNFLYARRQNPGEGISDAVAAALFAHRGAGELPLWCRSIRSFLQIPGQIESAARSAAMNQSLIYREDLRMERIRHLRKGDEQLLDFAPLLTRKKLAHQRMQSRLQILKKLADPALQLDEKYNNLMHLHNKIAALLQSQPGEKAGAQRGEDSFQSGIKDFEIDAIRQAIARWNQSPTTLNQSALFADSPSRLAGELITQIESLIEASQQIIGFYHDYDQTRETSETQPEQSDESQINTEKAKKYNDRMPLLPPDCMVGNPYQEEEIIRHVRKLLFHRLKPVRMTAHVYSTIAGHHHGAIPLNPVMKLWKRDPYPREKGEPPILQLEVNTPRSMECLIDLALLADPRLTERELQWREAVKKTRGKENLSTMRFFLLPGSCFPLREIRRADFPEFRGRVIGESRPPHELGVPLEEEAILTGGWYSRRNHSLYYTVGGDNATLIRTIWRSGRFPGPPAFFFALGQYVHDTLPDSYIYYRSGEKTFRQCVEEYYRAEDLTMKNRDEKVGRKRADNSRDGIRFMFAAIYARLIMEALTGSPQTAFRHRTTEQWMGTRLGIPLLNQEYGSTIRALRDRARRMISSALSGEELTAGS